MRKKTHLSDDVPRKESGCPSSLALIALKLVKDNNQDCRNMDSHNRVIQASGVLDAICDMMVLQWQTLESGKECASFPGELQYPWECGS